MGIWRYTTFRGGKETGRWKGNRRSVDEVESRQQVVGVCAHQVTSQEVGMVGRGPFTDAVLGSFEVASLVGLRVLRPAPQ